MVKSVEVLGSGVYLILDRQQRREISFFINDVITTIKEPIVSLQLHAGSIKNQQVQKTNLVILYRCFCSPYVIISLHSGFRNYKKLKM